MNKTTKIFREYDESGRLKKEIIEETTEELSLHDWKIDWLYRPYPYWGYNSYEITNNVVSTSKKQTSISSPTFLVYKANVISSQL